MRWSSVSAISALGLVAAGCAGGHLDQTHPPKWEHPAVAAAPVRIIDKKTAESSAVHAEDVDLPFGDGQNGTELLLVYLERAKSHHAAYVSDLYVAMMFKWHGFPIECRSRVYIEDEMAARAAAAPGTATETAAGDTPTYSTKVEDFRPKSVAYLATDMELTCKPHVTMVIADVRTDHDLVDEFDASNGWQDRTSFHGREPQMRSEEVCEKHPVTRDTVRYDYQAALGFVPVDWAEITRQYADDKLVEGPPACYRLEQSELTEAHHVLHGRLYYRAPTINDGVTPNADILEHYGTSGGDKANMK